MESLTGLDAAFLSFETQNAPLHVGAVIVFDPPPGKQLLFSESARFGFARRLIEQRIHLVPPFRRRRCRGAVRDRTAGLDRGP